MRLCAGGKRSRIGQDGYQSKRVDPNFSTSVALLKAFFFTPLVFFFWFFLLSRYYYYTRVSLSLFCFYWQTPGRIYSRRSVRVEKATLLFFLSLSLFFSPPPLDFYTRCGCMSVAIHRHAASSQPQLSDSHQSLKRSSGIPSQKYNNISI